MFPSLILFSESAPGERGCTLSSSLLLVFPVAKTNKNTIIEARIKKETLSHDSLLL